MTRRADEPPVKRLYSYADVHGDPVESAHNALTPYLFDAGNLTNRHLVVAERSTPLCGVPPLIIGSKPIDGGQYIFNAEERETFLRQEPEARRFFHPFIGTTEFLYNEERWILALQDAQPGELRAMPLVRERIAAVRSLRLASRSAGTQQLAATPTQFHVTVIPTRSFLVIPEVSSEKREYVPIAWLGPPVIPSNLVRVLLGASLWHFGILTSRMHMAWMRHIGGRLESRYRYSVGVVYNTFPWPEVDESQRSRIEALAQSVLDARAQFAGASLADLYDVDLMKPELARAHRALDGAVDRLYRTTAFTSDRERVEHLFGRYERLIMPPLAPIVPDMPEPPLRTRRRRAVRR